MTSIAYFPVVDTQEQLMDLLSRAAWHLSFCPAERIYVPIGSPELAEVHWTVPSGMDPSIARRLTGLKEKVRLVVAKREEDVADFMSESEIHLRWRKGYVPDFVSAASLAKWEEGKKVWQVDPHAVRMEGSFYIDAANYLMRNAPSPIPANKEKFARMVARLGRFKRAYLLATGPSVGNYKLFDYTDSIAIVCNSVILDEELMHTVKPRILVFADPIFHFGVSQYAAEYRSALVRSAGIHDFTICIPQKYYRLFTAILPELEDRTIGIPYEKEIPWNFSLEPQFRVRSTANILTFLMIPLAATFAPEVGIIGCDGRPLQDDTYFWGHNQKTQLNDQMTNIRVVHPGFFAIDYNSYYSEHCNTLEEQLKAAEHAGITSRSLGFSHIPALRSRMNRCWRRSRSPVVAVARVVLVDPDAKSWAGHYMAYNEKLSQHLAERGLRLHVLCRKDLMPEIVSARPGYRRTFTAHSWDVGRRKDNAIHMESFEREVTAALRALFDEGEDQTLLYMYCGSLQHLDVLRRIASAFPRLAVNINLFWLSFRLSREFASEWSELIEWIDQESDREGFRVTVPTREIREELAEYTGAVLKVAPHPSTGVPDDDFFALRTRDRAPPSSFRVLFPSAPRPEKGYELSVDCARLLASKPRLYPIVRHAPTFSSPTELFKTLEMPAGVEVIEGELTDDQFKALFARSHISVLPYSSEAFAKRTSGLLIDSLYYGLPCVVAQDTWLGNIVDKTGSGVVVGDLCADALADAVEVIASNYPHFRERAMAAGAEHFESNSWRAFGDFLLGEPTSRRDSLLGPCARSVGAHWSETTAIASMFAKRLSGSVMIDVGAHHGSALIPFLKHGWSVHAFEPDEINRKKLLERLQSHEGRSRVRIDQRCVSDKCGQGLSFFRSTESTGISGLSAFHETHTEAQKVDTVTLDEYFRVRPLNAIEFLKIDTEGYDLFVLKGFPWKRTRPRIIECEFEDAKTEPLGYTFHDLSRFLVDKGYSVYVSEWHPIIRYGIRHDWNRLVRYPCELAEKNGWGNLLAFRDGIDEAELVATVQRVIQLREGKPLALQPSRPAKPVPRLSTMTASLVGATRRRGWQVQTRNGFSRRDARRWHYRHVQAADGIWLAVSNTLACAAGSSLLGGLRVLADHRMTLRARLARHGASQWEAVSEQIELLPGVPFSVRLENQFLEAHQALRLQLDVLDVEGDGDVVMEIDDLYIVESLPSVRDRLGGQALGIADANRLFRDGDLGTAMAMYLLLHQEHGLSMYSSNAALTARLLGMAPSLSIQAMLESAR